MRGSDQQREAARSHALLLLREGADFFAEYHVVVSMKICPGGSDVLTLGSPLGFWRCGLAGGIMSPGRAL